MKKKILLFINLLFINLIISAESNDITSFIQRINQDSKWLPIEFIDVIKNQNRNEMKKIISDYDFDRKWSELNDCWFEWYEWYINYLELYNEMIKYEKFLQISIMDYKICDFKCINDINYLKIKQTSSSIYNTRRKKHFIGFLTPIEFLHKTPFYSENPGYYDNDEYEHDEIIIDAKFIFDGDYLTVYANNDKFKQVYFKCSDETFKQLEALIYNNTIDLSKVTWPRHADGTCDYEEGKTLVAPSSSPTNVSINKTMSVKENLKLRSAEATSSNVLTVMSAGTKVKVLEVGKEETIDGIKSNWVKVEVISGRDRDGKDIKKKTTGWCYGGYLE